MATTDPLLLERDDWVCAYCTHPIELYHPWDTHRGDIVHDECHTAQHNGSYADRLQCGISTKDRRR